MSAIVTALRDPAIARLKLTDEDSKRFLESKEHLLGPRDNYSRYMAALEGSHLTCIPFLGKHIT
jgi:hypothetical protein